jgi:hypothetical protein
MGQEDAMKIKAQIIAQGIFCLGLSLAQTMEAPAQTGSLPPREKPGDIERSALAKVGFLVGEWEGEGWRLTESGQRVSFWIKELYRYRGNKDLLDMEGRFADILPDGNKAPEDYALGILFYDRQSGEYRMWHYSSDGTVFSVKLDVDVQARTAHYTRKTARGDTIKFTLAVGVDGVWVSKVEILRPDNSWLKVLEFHMKRVAPAGPGFGANVTTHLSCRIFAAFTLSHAKMHPEEGQCDVLKGLS